MATEMPTALAGVLVGAASPVEMLPFVAAGGGRVLIPLREPPIKEIALVILAFFAPLSGAHTAACRLSIACPSSK